MAALASSFLPAVKLGETSTVATQTKPAQFSVVAVKRLQGVVVGTARDKTVSVEVRRLTPHPIYGKRVLRTKKFHAHDPENKCNVGDKVTLEKCRPVSKTKQFVVADIIPAPIPSQVDKSQNLVEEYRETFKYLRSLQ